MDQKYLFPEPEAPVSIPDNLFAPFDIEVDQLINAPIARTSFKVDGGGQCVAVLDTGLRVTHRCFNGRVVEAHNFIDSSDGSSDDVTDTNGHGTNITGIIAGASGDERNGIAPGANIVSLKAIPSASVNPIFNALLWVYKNTERLNISVVNFSFGIPNANETSDAVARTDYSDLAQVIQMLTEERVAVLASSGNSYYAFQQEGMTIPAIFPEVISVGAVYDSNIGQTQVYPDGAVAHSTQSDQITPYSQRLSEETGIDCYTTILGPGSVAVSAGSAHDNDTSRQNGTSQAVAVVTGVTLLLQQYYAKTKGGRPPISLIRNILRATSIWVIDGDNENDNVSHTGRKFPRISAYEALLALHRAIQQGAA